MATKQIPSYSAPVTEARSGQITTPWYQFLLSVAGAVSPSGPAAPSDGPYIVSTADGDLPNARVATDSLSIDFNTATAGQLKAFALVALAGALDGGSTSALQVRVDNTTIQINADNKLEVIGGGGYWSPLTNGDPVNPELVYVDGDVIMVQIP